jgi:UDP-N-acetyl-D-mannosaminuronic acid dehydrogenase
MKKKICVIGLGYIGLPTATLLVNHGYKVFGVDTNEKIIKKIQQQKINFTEPMLNSSVKSAIKSGRFKVFKKPKPMNKKYFIGVLKK